MFIRLSKKVSKASRTFMGKFADLFFYVLVGNLTRILTFRANLDPTVAKFKPLHLKRGPRAKERKKMHYNQHKI